MTHFIGAVIVPARHAGAYTTQPTEYPGLYGDDALSVNPKEDLSAHLDEVLNKFDEGRAVEPRIDDTRDEVLDNLKKAHHQVCEGRVGMTATVNDPTVEEHNKRYERAMLEHFPTDDELTDDEYMVIGEWYYDGTLTPEGNTTTTYNPDSKWDWWTIGGRWEGDYRDRQGETVGTFMAGLRDTKMRLEAGENLNPWKGDPMATTQENLVWSFPRNLVTPDGAWLEKGKVGWFGMTSDTMNEVQWVDFLLSTLETISETDVVYYIDFHI